MSDGLEIPDFSADLLLFLLGKSDELLELTASTVLLS
jgi:hypothetical protein